MFDSASVNSISSIPLDYKIYQRKFYTFTSVPVEESLSSEHSCELFSDSLEHFLDGG
jgi:hypothetical protein